MAITTQDIWQVADKLDAAGVRPTLAAVRKAVGGGSFTKISEAMQEWNARHEAERAPRLEPPPEAVVGEASLLAQRLWTLALEAANGRFQAEREALMVQRSEWEERLSDAAEVAEQMEQELDAAKQRITMLEKDLHETRETAAADLAAALSQRDTEHARAERAETSAAERADHIATLKRELEEIRAEHGQEVTRLLALMEKSPETPERH